MDKSNLKSLLDHLCYIKVPANTVMPQFETDNIAIIAKFCDIRLYWVILRFCFSRGPDKTVFKSYDRNQVKLHFSKFYFCPKILVSTINNDFDECSFTWSPSKTQNHLVDTAFMPEEFRWRLIT